MRYRLTMCMVILALAIAGTVSAQTGSIQGRVIFEDQPMPGVTVSVTSPALQGQMSTVTNVQGDYKIPFLPAGDYNVQFDLAEFSTLEYNVRISTNQPRTLDAIMYPEAMQEEILVTGQFENVSTGAQGSQTIEQSTLEKLPVPRTMLQAVGLAAGTSATGPRDAVSISGAQSYENLYTMNGVVMNENLRGQPFDMFIEDAILETTTMTSNMSAEYGRFSGGVVNMVTKSGGNQFSGSFRANFDKESWNGETPLTTSQSDTLNTIYEATFGGYVLRDKLWFFLAGRSKDESATDQIVTVGNPEAGIPFETTNPEDRYEGKLTWGITPSHRVMGSYMSIDEVQTNWSFAIPGDSLHIVPSRALPLEAFSFNYTGVLSDNFFLEGLYSERAFTFEGGGGTDPRNGATQVRDYRYGVSWNAPTFCSESPETPLCTDESRDNTNYYAKASWFANAAGTHDIVFGYDHFDDMRMADNWQGANGYQWAPWTPQDYSTPGSPLISALPNSSWILWGVVLEASQGNNFITDSLFVNDTWRLSDKWTVNLGLRYDKNDGTDAAGTQVVNDSRISPRLSAAWDVRGDGSLIVTAGASRYAMAVSQLADDGSAAGQSSWGGYLYGGPEIHAGTEEYPTNFDAMDAIFDWFFDVYGGPGNTDLQYWIDYPGLTPVMGGALNSPYGDEFTIGASLRLGTRGVVRADLVHRQYGDFYVSEIVPDRWVQVPTTTTFLDEAHYVNYDSGLSREYNAVQSRFDYRLGDRWNFGASYTYSKTEGNLDGEVVSAGPVATGFLEYQEYREPEWNAPVGYLASDIRHKFRGWVVWDVISSTHNNLSLSLLQNFWSGSPHSAAAAIDTVGYVGDPADLGYAGNPGTQTYFFSDRGAFRFDNVSRTDLALNYSFFINIGGGQLELFLQPEVQNVFNEQAVVTGNSTELTSRNDSSLEAFDPWTETPVEGTHWRKGDDWGQAEDDGDYQLPRTYRVSVGIRF
ncbi:MAG: TonB-dependent receptor [Acidobacteria bacterium]|nr:TonB-dependent receptor [Candidatus Sulfomarinibacter kjeldsenii]